MEIYDLVLDNRILYLSQDDLIAVGLLDYTSIVEQCAVGCA